MARLEDLTRGAAVQGVLADGLVTVVDVQWYGSDAVELTYKDAAGRTGSELLYRDREPTLEIATRGRPWSFDGDGYLVRLVSEAHRIRLAYLFDPHLAVHTSLVDPLPHQITAVYGELLVRRDLRRCLIVCPGSLAEQWQDELHRRFQLPFEILTNDKIESARTGNWFLENDLV